MGCGSSTHEPGSPKEAQPRGAANSSSGSGHANGNGSAREHHKQASADAKTVAAAPAAQPGSARRDKDKPKSGASSGRVNTEERFEIVKVLGEGASCKVVSAREKATNRMLAMKIMDKSESYNRVLWENETLILRTLRHNNILQWVDSYEDKRTYHLLTVLCQGGELFDRVKNGSFSEKVAARLTKEMLQALHYCHQHNIVHRDLKPENFVFDTPAEDAPMRLIDFGCAKVAGDDEVIADVAGSPYYVSPEVLSESAVRTGRVWRAADMWSVGVIIFLLVCGYPPFNGDSQEKIFKKIKRGKFRFPKASDAEGQGGINLSDSVKSLITDLLQMAPSDRLTAEAALRHPWVSGDAAPDAPLPSVVVDALSAFRSKMRLKKAVARVLAHHMTDDDRENLAATFKRFDVNSDGQLGPGEIAALMRHIKVDAPDHEIQKLVDDMDEDQDGGVSMDEFATHVTMGQLGKDKAQIKATFDMFDLDHDGFITHKEIEKVCDFLTPDATLALIKEVDANNDGKINFAEWLSAMTDLDIKSASGHATPAGGASLRKKQAQQQAQQAQQTA